jgi:replicative DNA helicase
MRHFHNFAEAMSGGMSWAEGVLFYVGGRANSGKTTFALNLGCDVALSDEDAIVIVHSTDDSYVQIEPRIKSALYRMTQPDGPKLSIGAFAQPGLYLPQTPEHMEAHQAATEAFRELLSCERLVIYDSEDGNTLSVLERAAKYYRRRFPSKKLLVISDNTYNYTDFASQENYRRMTMISDRQKGIAERYHLAMLATVEYRKNMPMDAKELRWPVDDDIADSRAFMYRSNVIIHIYNDLHDRKEHAEILYVDERGLACPRLVLRCSKNKISEYKGKMVFDLDPRSVTLSAVDERQALEEATRFAALKETKVVAIDRGRVIEVPVDDPEEGE